MSSKLDRRVAVPVQSPVHAHRVARTRRTLPLLPIQTHASALPSDERGTGRETSATSRSEIQNLPARRARAQFVGVDDDAVVREPSRDDTSHDQPEGCRATMPAETTRCPLSVESSTARVPSGSPDGDDRPVDGPRGAVDVEDDPADETTASSVVPAEAQPRLEHDRAELRRVETMAVGVQEGSSAAVGARQPARSVRASWRARAAWSCAEVETRIAPVGTR